MDWFLLAALGDSPIYKLCAKYVRTEAKGVSNVYILFAEILAKDDSCSRTLIIADAFCLCAYIFSVIITYCRLFIYIIPTFRLEKLCSY